MMDRFGKDVGMVLGILIVAVVGLSIALGATLVHIFS